MKVINRAGLIKVHIVLAGMILPVMLMFVLTGALYTWGIKGSYHTTNNEVLLNQPLTPELDRLVAVATAELERLEIGLPSGKAKVKSIGSAFMLEWTGAGMDVILQPTIEPTVATLEIKQTSWHRHLVQLHKAKGGSPFKVYVLFFAAALLLLFISGFAMALQMPKLRTPLLASAVAGIVLFIAVVLIS